MRYVIAVASLTAALTLTACSGAFTAENTPGGLAPDAASGREAAAGRPAPPRPVTIAFEHAASERAIQLAEAAETQVGRTLRYDPAYVALDYPGGDVPIETGVCTDVVVRAFRDLGVDLQVDVHTDMAANFSAYPNRWGLTRPDRNIDHRRVPNLMTYFKRTGKSLSVTDNAENYWPGDLVTWDVANRPHIGIVSTRVAADGERYQIIHNIGAGARIEDRLFEWPITGHYRPF